MSDLVGTHIVGFLMHRLIYVKIKAVDKTLHVFHCMNSHICSSKLVAFFSDCTGRFYWTWSETLNSDFLVMLPICLDMNFVIF